MKKKILFLATMVICGAICVSGTLAYFTAEEQAHNIITTNKIDIEIEEWQETEEGRVPYPTEKIDVMPGATVSKIVTVHNLAAESFIRASIETKIYDSEYVQMELSEETLEKLIALMMGSAWTQKEADETWWYYKEAVSQDGITEPLFTEVVFSGPNMTNEYQGCTVEIIVNVQAVQAANNGESALEAAGWSAAE